MFDSIGIIEPRMVGGVGVGVGVGIQGHIAANTANTVNATTGVGGGGKSVEELDRALNGH